MNSRGLLFWAGLLAAFTFAQPMLTAGPAARTVLWNEGFEDGDADCWSIATIGTTVTVVNNQSNSGTYSLKIVGNTGQGQGATVQSKVIQIDFTRDYTLQFAFRYDSFHWDRFATFGHIRLLLDYPTLPLLYDPVGNNSYPGHRVSETAFQSYLASGTWGLITVHCRPQDRQYAVFVNGTHMGTVSYDATVVPDTRFWFEDNHSSSNSLNAWYDDLKIWGFMDPGQCTYAIPGLPYDPDDCPGWANPPFVPYHSQYTRPNHPNISEPCAPAAPNGRCADACLHMLFDYYGDNPVPGGGNNAGPQEEIEAAANTNDRVNSPNGQWAGTMIDDIRRAGHFSSRTKSLTSKRAGCPPQGNILRRGFAGYSWHNVGYSVVDSVWTDLAPDDTVDVAASESPEVFETMIGSGYPLMVFIDTENYLGQPMADSYEGELDAGITEIEQTVSGHAILIIGYDNLGNFPSNPTGLPAFLYHDPALGKSLWIGQQFFWDSLWTSKRFVFAAPWEVMWLAPAHWCYSSNFNGTAIVTYTGPDPFDGCFPVNNAQAKVTLTNIGLQGQEVFTHALPNIGSTGSWAFTSWALKFSGWLGGPAAGIVKCDADGVLNPAAASTSYANYADRIGGHQTASQALQLCVTITNPFDPSHLGWPYGGPWWTRAGGSTLRMESLAGGVCAVSGTLCNYGSDPLPSGGTWMLYTGDPTVAECKGTASPVGSFPIPPIAPGDSVTVGPILWTPPALNSLGQPYFGLFTSIEHPLDPPESPWPQEENNYATLAEYQLTIGEMQTDVFMFWIENPQPTAMDLVLTATGDDVSSWWTIGSTPPLNVRITLPPFGRIPAMLQITPTTPEPSGAIEVGCFMYYPGGALVRQTGGATLTVEVFPQDVPAPEGWIGRLELAQSRPNPFQRDASIHFTTPRAGDVRLCVYDVGGRLVRTLVEQDLPAGWHEARWNGTDGRGTPVGNGVFFYRLEFPGESSLQQRMVLLRR
jgi:hypothetical protein